eukprot:5533405-Pyramimonas_sp.AAC.1
MISDAIVVARSTVAGSGHEVPWAKVMLRRLLDPVRRAVLPAGLWSYIDDIARRAESAKQKVFTGLGAAADVMVSGLAELRLQISSMT